MNTVRLLLVMALGCFVAACTTTVPTAETVPSTLQGRLSRTEVVKIAEGAARQNGVQLQYYRVSRARFAPDQQRWWVLYARDPQRVPGDHFGISVDDRTKETSFFGGR
jgi:hypothetical protein